MLLTPPLSPSLSISAGVGRTGCFIVIDAMLERMKHEKSVDIYGHVTCMRAQRNYMVQTEDQYIFIHEALLEAATCGNTEVPARNLYAHIQKLTQPPPGETVTAMELEFKVTEAHTSDQRLYVITFSQWKMNLYLWWSSRLFDKRTLHMKWCAIFFLLITNRNPKNNVTILHVSLNLVWPASSRLHSFFCCLTSTKVQQTAVAISDLLSRVLPLFQAII